jgi:hypothetical protein
VTVGAHNISERSKSMSNCTLMWLIWNKCQADLNDNNDVLAMIKEGLMLQCCIRRGLPVKLRSESCGKP